MMDESDREFVPYYLQEGIGRRRSAQSRRGKPQKRRSATSLSRSFSASDGPDPLFHATKARILDDVFENNRFPSLISSPSGQILHVNLSCLQLLNCRTEEVVGTPLRDWLSSVDGYPKLDEVLGGLQRDFVSHKSFPQFVKRRAEELGGSEFMGLVIHSLTVVRSDGMGEVLGIHSVLKDPSVVALEVMECVGGGWGSSLRIGMFEVTCMEAFQHVPVGLAMVDPQNVVLHVCIVKTALVCLHPIMTFVPH
eukprot:TRINITY_DN353_c0_g1_i5.p1 TRINITY_DN353_c0_g1~~TRINITY_DN353_c0_g1_i5.p1  ORF type:complete len:251 (-),score=47.68 TRINITY_DN353_c0_g1_i5:599-1351(-)